MMSQKGQSLVEFALVLPLLILLLFGIIDFGRIFHAYLTIDHAGREAARIASIGNEDKVIIKTSAIGFSVEDKIIDKALTNAIKNSDATIIKIPKDGAMITSTITPKEKRLSGSDFSITISYPITFLTPVIGGIVGPITLEDTTVMRVE